MKMKKKLKPIKLPEGYKINMNALVIDRVYILTEIFEGKTSILAEGYKNIKTAKKAREDFLKADPSCLIQVHEIEVQ